MIEQQFSHLYLLSRTVIQSSLVTQYQYLPSRQVPFIILEVYRSPEGCCNQNLGHNPEFKNSCYEGFWQCLICYMKTMLNLSNMF